MKVPVIGFIGFGEAAYLISQGLMGEGIKEIAAFDVLAGDEMLGSAVRSRAQELKIQLVASLGELISKSDIVFCTTSAKVAETIANEARAYLKPHHFLP